MKTLTYGTVPSFSEFCTAVVNSDAGPLYEISLPYTGIDYRNMKAAGLIVPERYAHADMGPSRAVLLYQDAQLYRLIENLTELHTIDSDAEFSEWAGNFASSILSTLGFEWV